MFPNLNAGTGPAAAILIGGLLVFTGLSVGWVVLIGGFGLSVLWAIR